MIAAATFAAVFLSRWLLAPKHLFYFDSVNFALALEEFAPALHQPQPPGYPLFVGLSRLVHLLVPSVELVFLLTGALGAAAAVLLLWQLGEWMFGPRAGFLSGLLLLFNPAFWLGGITNPVRVFLAVGAVAVALSAWRAWRPGSPRRHLLAAAATLGVAAGFRPDLILFLAPLVFVAGVRGRHKSATFALAGLLAILCALPWLLVLVNEAGGFASFVQLASTYLNIESRNASLLLGARAQSAGKMTISALVWNFLGALSWVWVLPWARKAPAGPERSQAVLFLGVWFLPAFLFHSLVHVGDPDQTLATVPVVCLLGGWALSRLREKSAGRIPLRWTTAATVAVAINVFLFFRPLPSPANAASYRVVRWVDGITNDTFGAIRELKASGPIFLVACEPLVTWRKVAYYFPDDPMLVIEQCTQASGDGHGVWLAGKTKTQTPEIGPEGILLPSDREIVWLLPPEPRIRQQLEEAATLKPLGPLFHSRPGPGAKFRLGGYSLSVVSP